MAKAVITIRPVAGGRWEVLDLGGADQRFDNLRLAIDYAKKQADTGCAEIQVLDDTATVVRVISLNQTERGP